LLDWPFPGPRILPISAAIARGAVPLNLVKAQHAREAAWLVRPDADRTMRLRCATASVRRACDENCADMRAQGFIADTIPAKLSGT